MADVKTSFRATYGLDAAGKKVINVAKADKTVMQDGVNVEYLIQENTIQQYDPKRTYEKNFAVLHQRRLWIAKSDVPKPTDGVTFNEGYWTPLRVDPKWYPLDRNYTAASPRILAGGEYITIDTSNGIISDVTFVLPEAQFATEGDSIALRDIGGRCGISNVLIKAANQSIVDKGNKVNEVRMTVPYSDWNFVYINKLWHLLNLSETPVARPIRPDAATLQPVFADETIVRVYDKAAPIRVVFPKYANEGDMIHFVGMDANTTTPYYHLELNSFDATSFIIAPNQNKVVIQRSLSGYFIYDATTKIWKLFDADMTDRLRTVSSDTNLLPNETVSVVGTSNAVVPAFTLTLPTAVEAGDQVTVALNYMRKGQTVNITASGPDMILTNKNLTQFPKRGSYPEDGNWVNVKSLQYNGTTDYPPVITFAYIPMGPAFAQWMVVDNNPMIERVDPANPARVGVIALATQAQANLDKGQIAANVIAKEIAITPETLANRTALESRQGIAKISTKAQNQLNTDDAAYNDLDIVTPLKLNQKQATEAMRGLAEIVSVTEVLDDANDTHIITPKKLDVRRATPTKSGVAQTVASSGVPATARNAAGTLIFNYADLSRIVTPGTLREWKATETQQGGGFLATDSEVIAGTPNPTGIPLLVTPEQLHKKTAQEGRIGFTQIANQIETDAGTDDFKYVTPKKLAGRIAKDNQTGIARFATQTEFNAGTGQLIADPARIKAFFSIATRTAVASASGLTQSGNLWATTTFNIVAPTATQRGTTRLSTQDEVDAGVQADTIVTPKTLQAKKAREDAEGIVRLATTPETVTGTSPSTAVSPLNLKNVIQVEKTWEASNLVRGTVLLSEKAMTFAGNDVTGSTAALLETYQKTGYAISPYELNKTLMNFLPAKAKAVDSDKLDGIDSTQFIRRDIAQTVNGSLTLTAKTQFQNDITATNKLESESQIKARAGFYVSKPVKEDNSGIYLYGGVQPDGTNPVTTNYGRPTYGIYFGGNAEKGNDAHGFVTGPYSIYHTISVSDNNENRGWVFKTINAQATTNVASISSKGDATFDGILNVSKTHYRLRGIPVLDYSGNGEIRVGASTNELMLISKTPTAIKTNDNATVFTTANYALLGAPTFVKKSGDTMTGNLLIQAASIRVTRTEHASMATAAPTAGTTGTAGSWSSNIESPAIYALFKAGYKVPVMDPLKPTIVERYEEFDGPGILSQVGTDLTQGTYQIWVPRPTAANASKPGHAANTIWTRVWNPVKNAWESWSYMFTSSVKPTASDIGAIPNNGSALNNLTIRDWIQVGNLRIYADPLTKSVRFEWIE